MFICANAEVEEWVNTIIESEDSIDSSAAVATRRQASSSRALYKLAQPDRQLELKQEALDHQLSTVPPTRQRCVPAVLSPPPQYPRQVQHQQLHHRPSPGRPPHCPRPLTKRRDG